MFYKHYIFIGTLFFKTTHDLRDDTEVKRKSTYGILKFQNLKVFNS